MKLFERHLTYLVSAVFMLLQTAIPVRSQEKPDICKRAEQIEISLLTCGPRSAVYSLYGHTAIRYEDKNAGLDLAINYGVFSFDKPFFVLRFVFGLTDYEMGIIDFKSFLMEYESSGCGVRQQTLNFTPQEKIAIAQAIQENYEPQNRVYRYNFFYDNCTTRARDILLRNVNGKISYGKNVERQYPSYREQIHDYNENHRWARFGNDLLLGVKADAPTTFAEHQFLPQHLESDFDNAYIISKDGSRRKLVANSSWALPPHSAQENTGCMPTPKAVMLTIALLVVAATLAERTLKRNWWLIDAALMTITGLCGLILLAMIFSEHPTVSLNLQILLFNPLNIFMLYSTIKSCRKGQTHWWMKTWTLLIIVFLIGGFIQSYAEGIVFLALSLLFRNILVVNIDTSSTTNE